MALAHSQPAPADTDLADTPRADVAPPDRPPATPAHSQPAPADRPRAALAHSQPADTDSADTPRADVAPPDRPPATPAHSQPAPADRPRAALAHTPPATPDSADRPPATPAREPASGVVRRVGPETGERVAVASCAESRRGRPNHCRRVHRPVPSRPVPPGRRRRRVLCRGSAGLRRDERGGVGSTPPAERTGRGSPRAAPGWRATPCSCAWCGSGRA